MRRHLACVTLAMLLGAAAAQAQPDDSVGDAVRTPLKDLNLDRKEIPAILVAAVQDPYDASGVASCPAIAMQLAQLNDVLGPDFDEAVQGGQGARVTPGAVARVGVESMIPFRGAVRLVSGASARDREMEQAADAGAARRGFLRGLARQKNCDGGPAEIAADGGSTIGAPLVGAGVLPELRPAPAPEAAVEPIALAQ